MNKVFKVIWSDARSAYVVVSEIAKNHGSKSCSTKKLLTMLLATGVMTCASVAPVMAAANPAPNDTKIEVGKDAKAKGSEGVAIGKNSEASASGYATAIGGDAKATGYKSTVVGNYSKATEAGTISIGYGNLSSGANAITIGYEAIAAGMNSFAFGSEATANKQASIAFGSKSVSDALGAIAIGNSAQALGTNSIAIGRQAIASKEYSVVIGAHTDKTGTGSNVTAVGQQTEVLGNHSTAVGMAAKANFERATAIGSYANALAAGSVALGAGSTASREAGVQGYDPLTGDNSANTSFAWKSTKGAVSVGGVGVTRQIINVAAGSEDTDAVNVAQLKKVGELAEKGWQLSANGGKATKVAPGAKVDFSGDDENITVSKKETDSATLVNVKLNRNLNVDSVHAGDFFMNNDMGIGFGGDAYITQSGLNANNNVISNVAEGEADTDAVNVSQLNKVNEEALKHSTVTNGDNITVTEGLNKDGGKEYNVALNNDIFLSGDNDAFVDISGSKGTIWASSSVAAGNVIMDGTTETVSGLGNTTTAYDGFANGEGKAATEEQLKEVSKVAENANQGWNLSTNGGKASKVAPGETVDFSGDKNISVSHDGTKVKVELNKDIDVNSVQTNALNSKYNLSVGTMAENGIMPFFVNSTGDFYAAHNKFHVDKDGKVTATAGEIGNVVLNNGVFTGHSALRDGELFVGDASGNYSQITTKGAKLGKVTVAEDGKISGVAAGAVTADSTDAVNGSQLHQTNENVAALDKRVTQNEADIAQNKADIAANRADIDKNRADIDKNTADIAQNKTDIKNLDNRVTNVEELAKKHTTVTAGDNITVTEDKNADGGKEYKVALDKDIKLDSVTTGQTVMNNDGLKVGKDVSVTATAVTAGKTSISDEGVKVGDKTYISADGLNANDQKVTNVAAGELSATSKDAVNGSQLYQTNQEVANNTNRINKLGSRVNKVGAGAAALAALHPLDFDPDAKWDFAAGYGNYNGENAAAIGAYYRPNEDTMFSVGGTFGNGENMVNAGVSFKLGSGSSHVSTSRVAMAKEIKELREHMAAQDKLIAQLTGPVNALTGSHIQADLNTLFPDVPKNHWAYDYVTKLAQEGYIEGYPDGNFKGDAMMTRYEFAAVIYRAMMNGAARDAKLGGDENLNKLLKEFEPELEYIRIDTIAKDKAGNPTIQRVRTVKANTNK